MVARASRADPAQRLLDDVLTELRNAGVRPTPLSVIAAATDRTTDDRLVQAVAAAAERRRAFGERQCGQ